MSDEMVKSVAGRVVQETEIVDTLSKVEDIIRSLDEPFVEIQAKPMSEEKWNANQSLAVAVSETDECLNCGKPLDEGGFCGFSCLQSWDGKTY